jgi:hypothetical protein
VGCAGLIDANFDHASDLAVGDGGEDGGQNALNGQDGAPPGSDAGDKSDAAHITPGVDAGADGGVDLTTYASAQTSLASKRFPGPLTSQGSRGMCTDSRFLWRDSDGTLHAWTAATQTRVDYTFKAPSTPAFFPGDSYISVPSSNYQNLNVYDPATEGSLLTSLPYKYASAGRGDGVVFGLQTGGGTKVQHWIAGTGVTDDVSAILSTQQPPSSFGLDEIVYPASVTIPYPLYIVNVAKKSTTSVTFDGSIGMYETLSTPMGLVVSYARSGPVPNIRLYQSNQDTSRVEIGDELANMPNLFPDTPANEHKFIAHITRDGNNLIYASAFGIFGYAMDKAVLAPLQLGPNKTVYVPDVLCVIPSARLLMFRIQGDAVGQVWALPLQGLLP